MVTLFFVYLGEIPEYVYENLQRTRNLFPHVKIVICATFEPSVEWRKQYNIIFIKHTKDRDFETHSEKYVDKNNFRDGYWKFTTERLIAISSYHEQFPDEKIIQVESDVLLMPNFPLEKFSELNSMAWMGYGAKADIGTIIFSPDIQSSRKLKDSILVELNAGNYIDMEILFNVRMKNQVELLPIVNSNIAKAGCLKSKYYQGESSSLNNQAVFEGLFDSASIGIWLTGQDPRNRFGITKVRTKEIIENGSVQVDPSQVTYKLDTSGNLFINDLQNENIPLYNLHIHSKELKLFANDWKRHLDKYINIEGECPRYFKFSLKIFFKLIQQNAQQETLFRFLLNIPIVSRSKRVVQLVFIRCQKKEDLC